MSRKIALLLGLWLLPILSGCPAMTPQGGVTGSDPTAIAPAAAPKAADSDAPDETPPADTPPAAPPKEVPVSVADADKPYPSGVSALPVAPPGDGQPMPLEFNFTFTGTVQPECREDAPKNPLPYIGFFPKIHYRVNGTVGAVLLDGTVVPLNDCEVLKIRLQAGTGDASHCEDSVVNEACSFSGTAVFRTDEKIQTHLFAGLVHACGDTSYANTTAPAELTFLSAAGPLPVCEDLKVTLPVDPSLLKKLQAP